MILLVRLPIHLIFTLLMFNQYFLFVLILAFLVMRRCETGEKRSSQASSGHVVELQKSYIQVYETGGTHIRMGQSQKYVLCFIFNLKINNMFGGKENKNNGEIKLLVDLNHRVLSCLLLPVVN